MDIVVHYSNNMRRDRPLLDAVHALESIQSFYHFILKKSDYDEILGEVIDWDEFSNSHDNTDPFEVYITEKPFSDNWFSHETYNYSMISTYDWESHFLPPSLKAYIAYQIAQSALNFVADMAEQSSYRFLHLNPTGCMYDFCGKKTDIKIGMAAGMICTRCKSSLMNLGVNTKAIEAVERMLTYVRNETIGRPETIGYNNAFVVMRFSKNDENHNAFRYGIKPALESLGIICNRGDDKVISAPILTQVYEAIKSNRFVIAKVDEDNLNVYYELELAMGMQKDVLLISERSLTINLPSDLRNWECLTYTRGDYDELKDTVIKYYKDHYHY